MGQNKDCSMSNEFPNTISLSELAVSLKKDGNRVEELTSEGSIPPTATTYGEYAGWLLENLDICDICGKPGVVVEECEELFKRNSESVADA